MFDVNVTATPGFALGVAEQVSSALWRDHMAAAQALTQPQFLALSELYHSDGVSHLELAERVGIDKVTIGPIIRKLAEQQWIERRVDPDDGRRSVLRLAEPGKAALLNALPAAEQMTEALMAPLSPAEQAVVVQAWATMARATQDLASTRPSDLVEGTAIPPPNNYPWFYLRIARRSFRRIWRDVVGDEISSSQFGIMDAISRIQPIDIRSAALEACVEETTAVRIVMKSARTRLVKDRRDPDDARRSLLALTEAGREEHGRINGSLHEIQRVLCAGIPLKALPECERLTRVVARLPL